MVRSVSNSSIQELVSKIQRGKPSLGGVPRQDSSKVDLLDYLGDFNSFLNRRERYLVQRNQGKASDGITSTIPRELAIRENAANEKLANTNVKARISFSAYSTALTYDQRARFVSAVSDQTRQIDRLLDVTT